MEKLDDEQKKLLGKAIIGNEQFNVFYGLLVLLLIIVAYGSVFI